MNKQMCTIKETAINFNLAEHFVRQLVKQNKITYVKAGVKYLINQSVLEDYLLNGDTLKQEKKMYQDTIRRVDEGRKF